MVVQIQGVHHRIGDAPIDLVGALVEDGGDLQAGRGRRAAQETPQRRPSAQGCPCPVQMNRAEPPLLDGIPLRAAGGIVTDRGRQAALIAQLLRKLLLPEARPTAVAALGVGHDHNLGRLPRRAHPFVVPPLPDRRTGELGRVRPSADDDAPPIASDIVDPLEHRAAVRLRQEVVDVHRLRFLTPAASRVFEVADQFLRLGVYADDRPSPRREALALPGDVGELGRAVRVSFSRLPSLGLDLQRLILSPQQPPDRWGLIACPSSANRSRIWRKLRRAHFCRVIGSPTVSGSISSFKAARRVGPLYDGGTPAAREADPIGWPRDKRCVQFLPTAPNRLLGEAGDPAQEGVAAPAHSIGLPPDKPAPLLLVEAARVSRAA